MKTHFVVRDTDYPEEDLKRDFSSPMGGFFRMDFFDVFESMEAFEARKEELLDEGWDAQVLNDMDVRFHPAYDGYVEVHYEGLGAWLLESENLADAKEEAENYSKHHLGLTDDAGDGHFYAKDVVSYHEVRSGRYVFEIKTT
ncbi:hypothetical protein FUAX_55910 (plasmid) [Fulvitalea axinellae]|uniref:Uncharacterized protein n=1 Tax=Fulvitalea axinellae TaxID=1182444 RepID=A0AAU9DFD7_9BACT|nr:hypothetical protein FUAX_55910 [Fulvitalea axinellae]